MKTTLSRYLSIAGGDRLQSLWLIVSLTALSACAGATVEQRPLHRPGPDLSGYYGTRAPTDLAYGHSDGRPPTVASGTVEIDEYLKPVPKHVPSRAPLAVRARREAARPPEEVVVASAEQPVRRDELLQADTPARPPAALVAQTNDAQRYAVRERQASKQMQYRGGDVVVISATTALIVLLVVLIIVLLT